MINIRLGLQQKVRTLEKLSQIQNTNNVILLELQNGQYFDSKTHIKIDIRNVQATTIIIDDIPRPTESEVDNTE